VHASWLNQVEAFLSILTRNVLERGEFASRNDLVTRMLALSSTAPHRTTTPFKWVCNAKLAV